VANNGGITMNKLDLQTTLEILLIGFMLGVVFTIAINGGF